ncbi:MAG TPA: hypothetical protein VHC47_02205 [Mucilaginibacter sp.]|nr:hypothetical protein [Mucilaginibacter sp.]
MTKNTGLITEAKVWVKREDAPGEIIRVALDAGIGNKTIAYNLYHAFEDTPEYLGRILFDEQGYWIYDGSVLKIAEQEQLAKFIIDYIKKHASDPIR